MAQLRAGAGRAGVAMTVAMSTAGRLLCGVGAMRGRRGVPPVFCVPGVQGVPCGGRGDSHGLRRIDGQQRAPDEHDEHQA
ncbi:hypothetical protein C1141_20850 [Vibrio agarivorans]|nr:hypothetical protein C1141_20850 [Vibrio agarivorans]